MQMLVGSQRLHLQFQSAPLLQKTKLLLLCPVRRTWDPASNEHRKREDALILLFANGCLSTQLLKYPEFRNFCSTLDPGFLLPGNLVTIAINVLNVN